MFLVNALLAWTGIQPCGFIFISLTHLFSLTHWTDCSRLQVCLQLWEFPGDNYRVFTDIFTLLLPSSFPPHLWTDSFPTRLHGRAKTPEQPLLLTTIPTTSYWPLRSLTALLPAFHPTSIHPRISLCPLTYHHRPHFKRGCGLTGSSNATPQAFVWEGLVHCRFTSLPAGPNGFRISRYWLLSRTDILVCKCACGT